MKKCVDALAFAALVAVGCAWSVIAFGQIPGLATGNGYPLGSTPFVGSNTGTTGAVAVSIPGLPGVRNYICGFSISTLEGVTAANTAPTVSSGGISFTYQINNAASTANTFSQTFTPCLPSGAANSAIAVTSPANANASVVDVNVWGYQAPLP